MGTLCSLLPAQKNNKAIKEREEEP